MKFFLLAILILLSCKENKQLDDNLFTKKTINKKIDKPVKKENSFTVIKKTLSKINTDSISNSYKLPFGEQKLIETKFPTRWEFDLNLKSSDIEGNKINSSFDTISKNLQKLFRSNTNQLKNHYIRQESITNSHLNKYLNTDKSKLKGFSESNKLIGLFPNKFNYKICLFSENVNVDYNKWGDLVIINKSGEIISGLNVYNYFEKYLVAQQKMFFIDKNYIIHIKDFLMYEDSGNLLQSKMYQISNEGKFIRYYRKDGKYKDDKEEGFVKNNTRNGKWIEKISNGFINDYTYVESEYKEGILLGKSHFYEYGYDKNEYGEPIIKTGKKGKLLYTETYTDGELQERTFVE